MKRGTLKNLCIDGNTLQGEYIGRGMFCTAYRHDERVYLLCSGDYSKECIALFCDKSLKHIPNIERHDDIEDYQVFSMPFYHKLTKRDYPKAYAQWKTLPSIIVGYTEASQYIDSEQNNTPHTVREAIRELIGAYCNYDLDGMLLEFNKANVGVNENGELILRDCLASRGSIEVKRKERANRVRGKHE